MRVCVRVCLSVVCGYIHVHVMQKVFRKFEKGVKINLLETLRCTIMCGNRMYKSKIILSRISFTSPHSKHRITELLLRAGLIHAHGCMNTVYTG